MREVEEKEFIEYLTRYANSEIPLKELTRVFETDYRTLQNKIASISRKYPDLYKKIVLEHSYMQKTRKDLDFRSLIIFIMKSGMTVNEATQRFGVSARTLQRRVEALSKTEPELVELYRKYTANSKSGKKRPTTLREEISQLEEGQVILGDINDEREDFLIRTLEEFEQKVKLGMTKNDAAIALGFSSSNDIYKLSKQLERIQKEKQIITEEKSFKDSLKVDAINNKSKNIEENNNIEKTNEDNYEER